jgi:hypothetical protein
MKIISHRGNLTGVSSNENKIDQIYLTHDLGFDVEIDIWFCDGQFYLGHDEPTTLVLEHFLIQNWIWCHAKNLDALEPLKKIGAHFFWHENDLLTITSRGILWCSNGVYLESGITVTNSIDCPKNILGVCTDTPLKYI